MPNHERYWLKTWEDRHVFEPDPLVGKKKIFVTFPFPYMNGPLHVGTAFTSARVEFYARFKRMQGYNVLFPWAWHWTGQSIVGLSYRLKKGDQAARKSFIEVDGVPASDVDRFVDPEYLASYYTKVSRQVVKDTGFSIDWRREFRTVDPAFRKFVEWQYLRLREMGYVVQGTHPVVWCSHDKSPTGDHDRMEGEGVSPEEFNLIKFQMGEFLLVAATLRPETIYGCTNVWVNPEGEYSEARVDGELWVVSSSALTRLSEQGRQVTPIRSFKGADLLGRYAMAPLTGKSVPVLPATFTDPDLATGVVYSVPAHAPYDLMGLKDVQEGRVRSAKEIQSIAATIGPVSIISLKGYSEYPAEDAVKKFGPASANDPKLDEATAEVYREEFHGGVMKDNSGPLSRMKVSEAKEKATELLMKTGRFTKMYELPERVVCRCGTRCYVKILENQWFLNYSNPDWKQRTRKLIEAAAVLPTESREWYYSTIEWLNDWPCARRSGMGTKLPWDKEWIVETLSDSTIYMAFYTLSKFVNQEKVGPDALTPELLDYVFFGRGSSANLAKASKIGEKLLKDMRSEFLYWYPVNLRNSAKELIPNHLTFFAFHHAAFFPEKQWPTGFSVNGMIQIEGKKMSKTKGNYVTWKAALDTYGADATRLALALIADGMDDASWRGRNAEEAKARVESVLPFVRKSLRESKRRSANSLDSWLLSTVHRRIVAMNEALDEMKMRRAASLAFLEIWNDLRWYIRRSEEPRRQTLEGVFSAWVRLIAPFTPFVAEDLNKELGGKGLVSQADWPELADFPIDEEAELSEQVVNRVMEDARSVLKVVKGRRKKLNIYVASDNASRYFAELASAKTEKGAVGGVVKKYAALRIQPDKVFRLQYEIGEDLLKRLLSHPKFDEFDALESSSKFISSELGLEVSIQKAGEPGLVDPEKRSGASLPLKPAFYIE